MLLGQSARDEELEREAQEMIEGKDLVELAELKTEIESSLAADRSFALELQYWSNVLKKIDEQQAKTTVEDIYERYFNENKEMIMVEMARAEAKKRAKDGRARDYQTPFTALKIDNIKKGMTHDDGAQEVEASETAPNARYHDGTLSPPIIFFEDAGYLQSLAVTEEDVERD